MVTRGLAAAFLAFFLNILGCATVSAQEPIAGPRPQPIGEQWVVEPQGVTVRTWTSGLRAPWSLAFLPDGRAMVSERQGTIRLVDAGGQLRPSTLAAIEVWEDDESGLMGLAVHPEFPDAPFIYAMRTWREKERFVNQVLRYQFDGDMLTFDRIVLDDIPAGDNHNGGRIGFGSDGMLYIGAGDIFQRELAQDLESLAGKILRLAPDGAIPSDNPFEGSPIWSLGHRNVQGLVWDPRTGAFYATEHGPSGEVGYGAYDEINLVEKGGNFGWPLIIGAPGEPGYFDPIAAWPEISTPPSGAAFWRGDMFVASLGGETLIRIQLDNERAVGVERWFHDGERSRFGRLRDAVRGPDGALYVLTANNDWHGDRRDGDDRILRLTD